MREHIRLHVICTGLILIWTDTWVEQMWWIFVLYLIAAFVLLWGTRESIR